MKSEMGIISNTKKSKPDMKTLFTAFYEIIPVPVNIIDAYKIEFRSIHPIISLGGL